MGREKAGVKRPRRVLLVDDHPVVRHGLRQVISQEPDLEVCGEAGDAIEALRQAGETKPDIAVIDLSLRGSSGLDLIKDFAERFPAVATLVLSIHDEAIYATRAVRAGAKGYVMKEASATNVLKAIRQVLAGRIYLSDAMSSRILHTAAQGQSPMQVSPESVLTDRELEVFELIGQGHGPAAIAERIGRSVKTVETHRTHIKEKLNIRDATELRRVAIEWVYGRHGNTTGLRNHPPQAFQAPETGAIGLTGDIPD